MSGKAFLDTNIFVYSFDKSAPEKQSRARQLIRGALEKRNAVISYQVIQEFLNVATRKFQAPIGTSQAQEYISTVFRPLLAVHSSVSLLTEALWIRERYRLSFYDSLIIGAAQEAGCSVLYSEDLQHGLKVNSVTITNPFLA